MQQMLYAMRFVGQVIPAGRVAGALRVAAAAPGCQLTSRVGAKGLSSTYVTVPGGEATFSAEITMTGTTSFQEVGTITFGPGNVLRFSTIGRGYLAPSADPSRRHGAVTWRIDGGDGQFAGATGLITANFAIDAAAEVVDHHCGVLLLPTAAFAAGDDPASASRPAPMPLTTEPAPLSADGGPS